MEAQIDAVLSRFVARANEVRNQLNSQAWGPSKALDEVSHAPLALRGDTVASFLHRRSSYPITAAAACQLASYSRVMRPITVPGCLKGTLSCQLQCHEQASEDAVQVVNSCSTHSQCACCGVVCRLWRL